MNEASQIWCHVFTNDLIGKIVTRTIMFITKIQEKFSGSRGANPTNILEIKAFMGLYKTYRLNSEDICRSDGCVVEIVCPW